MTKKKATTHKSNNISDLFSNDYINLGILLLFWFILFRNLITGTSWLYDDFAYVYYPGKFLASVSLANGIIPFWNPFSFSGAPFFADPQIALFYPFNYLLKFFVSNNSISSLTIQLSLVLHYLLLSIACYYLALELKFQKYSAVIFAILYTYCGYMIVHMIHFNLIETVIWLPFTLLFLLKYFRTLRLEYILICGLLMGVCILAGYPQCFFYNFVFIFVVGAYYLYKRFREKDFKTLYKYAAGLAVLVVISVGMSIFQLLPTYVFSQNTDRAAITYDFATQGSIHPWDMITLLMPKFFGTFNWNQEAGELSYWSTLKNGGHQEGAWMFTISTMYMTMLPLLMLIPVVRYAWQKKYKEFPIIGLSILALIILFFSFGKHFFVHTIFYHFVPVFNSFRNPGHIAYLFSLCILLLSLFGINELIKDRSDLKKYFSKKYFIAIGIIIFGIFIICKTSILQSFFPLAKNAPVSGWISSQANTFLLVSLMYIGALYFFINEKIKSSAFKIILLFVILLDLHIYAFDQNNSSTSPESLYSQHSDLLKVVKDDYKDELFRVNMREGGNLLFQRYQGATDRVEFIEGINVLRLNRIIPFSKPDSNDQSLDLLNVKYKIMVDKATQNKGLVYNEGYMPRAKMFYDVKVIADTAGIRNYMSSNEFDYRKTVLLEKQPPVNVTYDSVKDASSTANVVAHDLNTLVIDVNAADNGYLLLSEIYYPDWKAYVDGVETEIFRADYCLRSVYVPKGNHKVELRYESKEYNFGSKISIITLLISFIGLGYAFYDRKRKAKKDKGDSV